MGLCLHYDVGVWPCCVKQNIFLLPFLPNLVLEVGAVGTMILCAKKLAYWEQKG